MHSCSPEVNEARGRAATHRSRRKTPGAWRLSAGLTLALAALLPPSAPVFATQGLVSCSQWQDKVDHRLRGLVRDSVGTLPANYGNRRNSSVTFLVVEATQRTADSASNALVFFNGTSGVMSDWPLEMVKSSAGSLCEDHTLVFFDYPGIGGTPVASYTAFGFDGFARDVDALLDYVDAELGLGRKIETVHPLGWSLGSLAALRFAGLAAANGYGPNDSRRIGNVLLIATKPGGDLFSGVWSWVEPAHGHQGSCVTQVTAALQNQTYYQDHVKRAMVGLLFPYVYTKSGATQGPYLAVDDERLCVASSITTDGVTLKDAVKDLGIETECEAREGPCRKVALGYFENRRFHPYRNDNGLPLPVYQRQRQIVRDWNYAVCVGASSDWRSTDCARNQAQPSADLHNGGVCVTVAPKGLDSPDVLGACLPLSHITGRLVVINGREDLFIQHDYGRVVADAYRAAGVSAAYHLYPGSAGHGVLLTDPDWVGSIVYGAMAASGDGVAAVRPDEPVPPSDDRR